jgi:hypothetical protein
MENLIGKWGGTRLQNIVWNNQPEFVHPDDWENLKNYKYIKSLHKFISKSDDYLLIGFGETKIRVVDSIFYPFDFTPKYTPFEKVKLINSKGELEFGIIAGIHWHNNDRIFYYDVEVNNKIKGRRYFDNDLESNENK